MKKMDFSKHYLAIFMMLCCFGLTTINAQSDAVSSSSSELSFERADKDVVKQNIQQEIISLKTSIQGLTVGSVDYVDGMRRIETFAVSLASLEEGSPSFTAYNDGAKYLYEQVEYKEAEQPQIDQIQESLYDMFIY